MNKCVHLSRTFDFLLSIVLILYIVPLYSQADIYLYNEKTGVTTQVTNSASFSDFNPAFSKNGKYLIFDRFEVANSGNTGLYSGSLSSGSFALVSGAEGGNDATWSPNGKSIAFDRIPFGDFNIYVLPSSGGTPSLMAADGIDPDWSPNGAYIVYQDLAAGTLSTVNVETGVITSLGVDGLQPDWSNNGKYIAYSFGDKIFKLRISSAGSAIGSPIQITSDPARLDNHPTWSKNNKEIIYASFDSGFTNSDIYSVNANGGTGSVLAGTPTSADFDPDEGKKGIIAYSGTDGGMTLRSSAHSSYSALSIKATPNVLVDKTIIEFNLEEASPVTISVWDMSGRSIENLVNETLQKGYQSIEWKPKNDLISGIYLLKINSIFGNNTIRIIKR